MWPSPQSSPLVASQTDPTSSGQVDLGPRVKIHDVLRHAARLVGDHSFIGELHEVSADESGGEATGAQCGHEKDGRVRGSFRAPRRGFAPASRRRSLRGLSVAQLSVDGAVEGDNEINRRSPRAEDHAETLRDGGHPQGRIRCVEARGDVSCESPRDRRKRDLCVGIDEEVERVDGADVDGKLNEYVECRYSLAGVERDTPI